MENNMEVSQKAKNRTTIWPINFILRGKSKTDIPVPKGICTVMFIATLLTIAKIWKQPECPLTDKWIINMCIHTHNDILSHKKNIFPFSAIWMDLKGIMLNEISQRNTNTLWYHLYVKYDKKKKHKKIINMMKKESHMYYSQ